MKVRILRSAIEDLDAARAFYERQQPGVGSYFIDSLFTEIDSLVLFAGVHRVHLGYHRLLAHRFPYAVYYRIVAGEALVYRVLDCRRDPHVVRKALAPEG